MSVGRARRTLAAGVALLSGCGSAESELGLAPDAVVDVSAPAPATGSAGASEGPAPVKRGPFVAPAPDPAGAVRFEGTVRVSRPKDAEHRMVFSGVTIERGGSEHPVVVGYASAPAWDALDGRRVRALGQPYTPMGRAIFGDHMTILELAVIDPKPEDLVIALGRTREAKGTIARESGEKGSKSEGASWLVLQETGGAAWEIAYGPASGSLDELVGKGEVALLAREVTFSPFAARRGGPFVWVTGKPSDRAGD